MRAKWSFLLFLLLVTGFVFHGALRNGFYWDDRPLIIEGKLINSWRSVPAIFLNEFWHNVDLGAQAPTTTVDTYRPFLNLSFLVDHQIWGMHPSGFHLTNLLIHLANVMLLYSLAITVLGLSFGWLATALFAVHPLVAESVHYIAARSDSLTLLFCLAALYIGLRKPKVGWVESCLMATAFLCGAFVKETALIFPALWFVGRWLLWKDNSYVNWKLPITAIVVALVTYTALRLHALGRAKAIYDHAQLWEILLNFPRFTGHFVRHFLFPIITMPMQKFAVHRSLADVLAWAVAGLFYGALGLAAFLSLRDRRLWGFFLAWIGLFLFPAFFAVSLTEVTNPRYLYCAVAGGALLVGWLVEIAGWPRMFTWVGMLAIGCLGFVSWNTASSYRNEETFYRNILRENPHHAEAEYNLANSYFRRQVWRQAVPLYKKVLKRDPNHLSARNNLGVALMNAGYIPEAETQLRQTVQKAPKNSRYLYNLAIVIQKRGRRGEACQTLAEVVKLQAAHEDARARIKEICGKE